MNVAVIGAGLTGCAAARTLADSGHNVTIFEKAIGQYGGSCANIKHEGTFVSKYGPHIFHSNSKVAIDFVERFTTLEPYEHKVLAFTSKGLLPWPINITSLMGVFGKTDEEEAKAAWLQDVEITKKIVGSENEGDNFESAALCALGGELYRVFIEKYTETQWGRKASELPAELFKRIRVLTTADRRFFDDKVVALPKDGYSAMFERILDSDKIKIKWQEVSHDDLFSIVFGFDQVINTASPSDLIEGAEKLPFRQVKFNYQANITLNSNMCPVVNINDGGRYTRVTDYSALYGHDYNANATGAEEPVNNGGAPLYPIRTVENVKLYNRYVEKLEKHYIQNTGRMGGYSYINMDQAVLMGIKAALIASGGIS